MREVMYANSKDHAPLVSVIICTYDFARLRDLEETLSSILHQEYESFEAIVAVDGNEELFRTIGDKQMADSRLKIVSAGPDQLGLSMCRNFAIGHAKGDIVCFIDDDAVADVGWLGNLVKAYSKESVLAVGGRIEARWLSRKPEFLPEHLYWLVGSTDGLMPSDSRYVRNAFGSNISFRRELLGRRSFTANLGRRGSLLGQAEDADICLRVSPDGILYEPHALVYHKVFPDRVRLVNLLSRAFMQGFSKGIMFRLQRTAKPYSVERQHLKRLLYSAFTNSDQGIVGVKKSFFTFSVIALVFVGFVAGLLNRPEGK